MTKPGDVDHYTRVRIATRRSGGALPEATRGCSRCCRWRCAWAGLAKPCWHAIIRKNYGCTTSSSAAITPARATTPTAKPFYGPYDAQELMREHEKELGIEMVPFKMMVYVEDQDAYMPIDEVPEGTRTLNISGTELRERLAEGREIPEWFTFPEVATAAAPPPTRASSRGSRCSSPGCPAPASRRSPTS